MATLQASDINDLANMTLRDLGRFKWTDITSDLQKHVAMNQLIRKSRTDFQSGYEIRWNLMKDHNNSARAVGFYEPDSVDVPDVMDTAQQRWAHYTANCAFDRRELAMNRDPAKIVDLVRTRRIAKMVSLAELLEDDFWSLLATTNVKNLHGAPYYIVWTDNSGTNPNGGFDGSLPGSFTTVANINSDNVTRWKNWCAKYTNVTKTDLVRKMRRAMELVRFTPAVQVPQYGSGRFDFGLYTTYDVLGELEELAEAQNDNLGNDIASKDGMTVFRRTPLMWVPWLQQNQPTADPLYGINWSVMKTAVLSGEYMKESGYKISPLSHYVHENHIDNTLNPIVYDRRCQFVLAKSQPTSG